MATPSYSAAQAPSSNARPQFDKKPGLLTLVIFFGVLARRVQSAVNQTCAPRTSGLDAFAESRRCRAEMMQDATVQTAALLTRNGTQLASLAGR